MGKESERYFRRENAIHDTYLLGSCAYLLIDAALRANAAYSDAKEMGLVNQMRHIPRESMKY